MNLVLSVSYVITCLIVLLEVIVVLILDHILPTVDRLDDSLSL